MCLLAITIVLLLILLFVSIATLFCCDDASFEGFINSIIPEMPNMSTAEAPVLTETDPIILRENIAKKHFGVWYDIPPVCITSRILNQIPNLEAGSIPLFRQMQGIVYKIKKPGTNQYIMLDKFDFINNKVNYYQDIDDYSLGNRFRYSRCADLDLRDSNRLVLFSDNPTSKIITFYYNNNDKQYYALQGSKATPMTEENTL